VNTERDELPSALVPCPACNGTGSWHNGLEGPNADWGDCSYCEANGTVTPDAAEHFDGRG
jgi:hypothetical protein